MIRLPQLSATSINNTPAPNVDVSSGTNAIAGAIANVSDAFTGIARDIARADNARKESEFRQSLATDYSNLQLELNQITDPAERLARTDAFLNERAKAVDAPDFPPVLRDKLRSYYDDFATTSKIRAAQDAAQLTQTRARKALANEIETAKQYGDPAAFDIALQTGLENGILFPEDADALRQDFDQSAAEAQFMGMIEQEPQGALIDLETDDFLQRNPNILPESLPKLKSFARRITQERRAEETELIEAARIEGSLTMQDIEDAEYLTPSDRAKLLAGMKEQAAYEERQALELKGLQGPLTPEEIDAAKSLTPLEKEKLKSEQTNEGIPLTKAHSEAWDKLFAMRTAFLDPAITDEKYAEMFNDTRIDILSKINPKYSGDLRQELSYRSPANRKAGGAKGGNNPSPNTELVTSGKARLKKAFDGGAFGDPDDIKSWDKFESTRHNLSAWMDANPTASWPEVIDYTTKLVTGEVGEGPALTIPDAPAAINFDTRLNRALGIPDGTGGADTSLLPAKPTR